MYPSRESTVNGHRVKPLVVSPLHYRFQNKEGRSKFPVAFWIDHKELPYYCANWYPRETSHKIPIGSRLYFQQSYNFNITIQVLDSGFGVLQLVERPGTADQSTGQVVWSLLCLTSKVKVTILIQTQIIPANK